MQDRNNHARDSHRACADVLHRMHRRWLRLHALLDLKTESKAPAVTSIERISADLVGCLLGTNLVSNWLLGLPALHHGNQAASCASSPSIMSRGNSASIVVP